MKCMTKQKKRSVNKKVATRKVAAKRIDRKADEPNMGTMVQSDGIVTRSEMMSWIRATSEAMEAFDFKRAAECYAKLEWTWIKPKPGQDFCNCDKELPTEEDIRDEVRRMIDECIKGVMDEPDAKTSYHCSTGGLYVVAYKYPNPDDNWIWIGMTCVETMF